MDCTSFCSNNTFDETLMTLSASTIGRPSETMTATHGSGGGVAVSPAGGATTTAAAAGGARSPPFRGRTMKEYEEMLGQLRKENFNLKLRLYFLEERGGAAGEGCGDAGAEVRLELEQLRRDAADKQQLLCEAARAVELLEEQHRDQLRAARHAAQQAHVEAQQARAHAQQLAAEAQRAREEAEAEVSSTKKAASDAAAEAALENERLRMELMQAREAAQEAAESARAARLAAAAARPRRTPSPCTASPPPLSPRSPLSRSPSSAAEAGAWACSASVRGAVERAQTQLTALEAELAAVRAELRRQTEARAAAERGLAEGRAVHAKSLQTVQALAKLCKERDREAEGLRARLERQQCNLSGETEERGRASGDEGVAATRPTPTGSPAPLPPPASPSASDAAHPATPPPTPTEPRTPTDDQEEDKGATATATTGNDNSSSSNASRGLLDASTATLLRTNVTLRRNVEKEDDAEDERQRLLLLQLRAQLEDKNEHLREVAAERDVLSGGLVRRLQALQTQAREQEDALAARDQQLRDAEERAQRLEEEVGRLRASATSRERSGGDESSITPMPPKDPPEEQRQAAAEEEEDEKDRLIVRLRTELRQRTANLQELVNKELWDKNRQIERLQERLARIGSPRATPVHEHQQQQQQQQPTSKEDSAPSEKSGDSLAPPPSPSLVTCPSSPRASSTPPPPPFAATATSRNSSPAKETEDAEGEEEEREGVEEEEAALRRRLEESVRERACLAAQLDDLRRRLHDASAASTCSESGVGVVVSGAPEAAAAAVAEAAAARAAQARAEADRRDALTACSALARRLDALARALPPLLRRHHSGRARAGERRSTTGGTATGVGGGGGGSGAGSGGGRRLRALERALSAAARAARALGGVEGAAEFALLHQTEGSPDVTAAIVTPVDVAVNVSGAIGDTNSKAVWSALEPMKQEEGGAPDENRMRVSESEVDAWSEPDRTVSLARVGLSPLSDRRAAAATMSASSDEELDEAASRASHTGDPWASDDTIESSAEKLVGSEQNEVRKLQARVAELETRVCEKDNELLEQQCALLEMRNTYTARCLQAEGQLSELLVQVRQVQADAEAERRSVRDQVTNTSKGKECMEMTVGSPAKSQDNTSGCEGSVALADRAQAAAEAMEVERLSAEFALGLQQQIQVNEARQREAEAERRRREADAALLRQRDAAAMAQSRAALERTQLLGERVRLERALRREEAAAAAAARAYRHERRQLQEQVLSLQANNHKLNRQLADISVLHLSPPLSPAAVQSTLQRVSGGGVCSPHSMPIANMDHHLGVCPLSTSYRFSRREDMGSLGSGLDAESLGSGSPPPAPLSSPQLQPGSPWQLNAPHSLPTFSRQHSTLSTGYASAGDCGLATSPQTCGGGFNWITRRPGEPSHGAGSPDLGIESDAGRFSSLEPLSSHCGSCDQEPTIQSLCGFQGTEVESDFARLQKENNTLRRNLSRTKKLLEATVTQLSTSNQMKRQMEMAICKQLNKTHSVLKQVKADSEVSVEPVK